MKKYIVVREGVVDSYPLLLFMDGRYRYILEFRMGKIECMVDNFALYEVDSDNKIVLIQSPKT